VSTGNLSILIKHLSERGLPQIGYRLIVKVLDVTILVAVHLLREGKAFRGTGHYACSFEDVYAVGHRGDAGRR